MRNSSRCCARIAANCSMMRLLGIALFSTLWPVTVAFVSTGWVSSQKGSAAVTHLYAETSRRDVLGTAAIAVVGLVAASPRPATAKGSTFFYDDKIELVKEPQQMATGGKVDLNAAFVGDYKQFPGMFPHAAGMIASNGPYASVKDIYSIKGLTENDKKLFKKYEKEFTTNTPGRSFLERINNRVST